MHYFLYTITDTLNNKVYVGQTINPSRRWKDHQWLARNKQEQYIHRAMAKYGSHNFIFQTIAGCRTQKDADETEKLLIIQYNSRSTEKGYNVSPGGDAAWNRDLPSDQQPMYGKKQSEYFKQRMSEVHTGKTVIHSRETRNKISISNVGHEVSLQTRQKISMANTGKIRTQENRDALSKAHLGRKMSRETKDKISVANIGRALSKDHKSTLRLFHTGKKLSEETKNKISVANMGKYTGEKNGNSKLTWLLVDEIRKEYSIGNITQASLAEKYGVEKSTIGLIIRNKIWKSIKEKLVVS